MAEEQKKVKVLVLGEIAHADDKFNDLKKVATVLQIAEPRLTEQEHQDHKDGKIKGEELQKISRTRFLDEIKENEEEYRDVKIICRTFASVGITGRFDAELIPELKKAMPNLKFVCHNGAGYDQVDIPSCTKAAIEVSNVRDAVYDSTADLNMFLILGVLRNFNPGMTQLRTQTEGSKIFVEGIKLGHTPQGKTLGILGMGGIGKNLMKKARAFGMKVIYYNRSGAVKDEKHDKFLRSVTLDELYAQSDVLSINCPLNDNTRGMIGAKEFAKMKDGVYIVNTARGAIIKEAELVEALNSGKVRSVGLDVYENEPVVHQGLIQNPNVMLIPHMGTHTYESQKLMEEQWLGNAIKAATEGTLVSKVPDA
ncbi:hypothetical protein BJ508DRAFT_418159 [Ascobolus immersus RN42]|uniref:Glyoxylate reductase n=1 Tax=Ascobolus immersus RN42 TaxID=1160509 RepID=A0A3N4HUD1_ASCIM|nr:hypothetical protein BJ508DRAFT_418159 [Ascobolus immersus RN42]